MENFNTQIYTVKKRQYGFGEKELLKLGVVFFEKTQNAKFEVGKLVQNNQLEKSSEKTLEERGFTMKLMPDYPDKQWLICKSDYPMDFIESLYTNTNFYTITLNWRGEEKEVFENAYLTVEDFNEDLDFYINNFFKNNIDGPKAIVII